MRSKLPKVVVKLTRLLVIWLTFMNKNNELTYLYDVTFAQVVNYQVPDELAVVYYQHLFVD